MASPSVTFTFSNGTTADATQINQNFTDLINGVSDGTKDISVAKITCGTGGVVNSIAGGMVINNAGGGSANDVLRVESTSNTAMLYVDAANDRVGINNGSPDVGLHAKVDAIRCTTANTPKVQAHDSNTGVITELGLQYVGTTSGANMGIQTNDSTNVIVYNGGGFTCIERSSDPVEPSEGFMTIWMSDGTGKGDDGDVMIASKAGGVTKYTTLFDHSAGSAW